MNADNLIKRLGRIEAKDPNDKRYLIQPKRVVGLTSRYWNDTPTFLDQGDTPTCVGHSWTHFWNDGPVKHKNTLDPFTVYSEAQKVDEWEGESYDGTSVRAGAKVLQATGKISAYQWAFDVVTMANTILTTSPVILGINWYYDMFFPDKKGVIKVGGYNAGGHAIVCNGVNVKTKMFRLKNSWSKSWGLGGRCYISFNDMDRLLSEEGECCLPVEVKTK